MVHVVLPKTPATYATLTAVISSITAQPESITLTATINFADSETGCVEYVPGSTRIVVATAQRESRSLPDGITQGGINIGDVAAIPPRDQYFVVFRVKAIGTAGT
jgi:hypothetical protein